MHLATCPQDAHWTAPVHSLALLGPAVRHLEPVDTTVAVIIMLDLQCYSVVVAGDNFSSDEADLALALQIETTLG